MVSVRLSKLRSQSKSSDASNEAETFIMRNFQNLSIDLRTPISPMPLPEERDEDNILVKVEGNTTAITYSFVIKNEKLNTSGTDRNETCFVNNSAGTKTMNGTSGNSKRITVRDQIDFLRQALQGSSIDDHYKLAVMYSDDGGTDLDFFGFVNNITCTIDSSAPVTAVCTISFLVGDTIVSLDEDLPNEPSLSVASPSGTSITLTIGLPTDKGGAGNIVNYWIQYSDESDGYGTRNSAWIDYASSDSSISGNVTKAITSSHGITAGKTYSFRVAAKDSNSGKGEWSGWHTSSGETT